LQNSTFVNDRNANANSALYFNGVADRYLNTNMVQADIAGDFTIAFWVDIDNITDTQFLFMQNGAGIGSSSMFFQISSFKHA